MERARWSTAGNAALADAVSEATPVAIASGWRRAVGNALREGDARPCLPCASAAPMRLASLLTILLSALSVHAQPPEVPPLRLLIEVRDAETGAPLPGARVAADSTRRVTDAEGTVRFLDLAPGGVTVSAAFLGYTPADTTLALTRSVRLAFALRPEPQALAQVEVEGERVNTARLERVGFYARRDERAGVFLTREDLDRRGAVAFSDAFRAVPGLRIETRAGRATLVSTRRRSCSPAIFLDGTRAQFLEDFLDSVSLRDVLAVEVYRGPAEVPLAYSATIHATDCGAVLVWTRAR